MRDFIEEVPLITLLVQSLPASRCCAAKTALRVIPPSSVIQLYRWLDEDTRLQMG